MNGLSLAGMAVPNTQPPIRFGNPSNPEAVST